MIKKIVISLVALSVMAGKSAFAEEDFEALLKRASELNASGKYRQAINELQWAEKQLTQAHSMKLQEFFPKLEEGYSAKDFDSNTALGMLVIKRKYTTPSGAQVEVTLTGSSSSDGGMARGIGAFAGMAQMAAMMDASGRTDSIRVHGKRAIIDASRGKPTLTLTMAEGLVMQVEASNSKATREEITALAEGFDVPGLEAYFAE